MPELKTGARLKSTVCAGEIMVVLAPEGATALTCGGAPMVPSGEDAAPGTMNADHAVGMQMGKRYVTESGDLEVLCVKAGEGGVALDGQLLLQKDTRKLPKTD